MNANHTHHEPKQCCGSFNIHYAFNDSDTGASQFPLSDTGVEPHEIPQEPDAVPDVQCVYEVEEPTAKKLKLFYL